MEKDKKDVFVHFLNREMYRSLGISYLSGVNEAIRILLLSCKGKLYIPWSSLWESAKSNDLDYRFFKMAYDTGQVEVVSDCITLDEFLERNAELYSFDYNRYGDIYFNKINELRFITPTVIKPKGATLILSENIEAWANGSDLGLIVSNDADVLSANKHIITKTNREREGKALTVSLFSEHLQKQSQRYAIARLLSTYYIKDYCQSLKADIATGINQIALYDNLSELFPFFDVALLYNILEKAGLNIGFIKNHNYHGWERILTCRRSGALAQIQDLIRDIIKLCLIGLENNRNESTRFRREEIYQYLFTQTKDLQLKKIGGYIRGFEVEVLSANIQRMKESIENNNYVVSNRNTQLHKQVRRKGMQEMENRLFISHSSLDEEYVKIFVSFLEGIGMNESQILCTSIAGYGIPLGEDIYDFLKEQFNNFYLHVFFILSKNYYNSPASLNEMGAAWVLQKEYTSILLPDFSFSEIKGAVDARKNSIKLGGNESIISDLLNQLRDKLQAEFKLPAIHESKWERLKKDLFDGIRNISKKV